MCYGWSNTLGDAITTSVTINNHYNDTMVTYYGVLFAFDARLSLSIHPLHELRFASKASNPSRIIVCDIQLVKQCASKGKCPHYYVKLNFGTLSQLKFVRQTVFNILSQD